MQLGGLLGGVAARVKKPLTVCRCSMSSRENNPCEIQQGKPTKNMSGGESTPASRSSHMACGVVGFFSSR